MKFGGVMNLMQSFSHIVPRIHEELKLPFLEQMTLQLRKK